MAKNQTLSSRGGYNAMDVVLADAPEGTTSSQDDPDDMEDEPQPFAEDIFGMASACVIRDLHFMQMSGGEGRNRFLLRASRSLNNVGLLVFNLFLQVYLLVQVKTFVTAPAVKAIRDHYDDYERAMYSETWINANGYHRGSGFFNESHFEALDDELKDIVCSFPLSQSTFFVVILLMWSLRVVQSLRAQYKWWVCLIFNTANAQSIADCFKNDNGKEWDAESDSKERVVYRLPIWVKLILVILIGLPRLAVTSVLLWLGCRWLCATTDFADLILNAVALEFILNSKDLLYEALVSYRTKKDVSKTLMQPMKLGVLSLDVAASFGALGWALLAALWSYSYMAYFQQVLPGYQWDIHRVCEIHQELKLKE